MPLHTSTASHPLIPPRRLPPTRLLVLAAPIVAPTPKHLVQLEVRRVVLPRRHLFVPRRVKQPLALAALRVRARKQDGRHGLRAAAAEELGQGFRSRQWLRGRGGRRGDGGERAACRGLVPFDVVWRGVVRSADRLRGDGSNQGDSKCHSVTSAYTRTRTEQKMSTLNPISRRFAAQLLASSPLRPPSMKCQLIFFKWSESWWARISYHTASKPEVLHSSEK